MARTPSRRSTDAQGSWRRAVALAEANVAASLAYVVLIGALSLTAALDAGWRVALLASLVVPALAWWSNRRLAIDAPPPPREAPGRLPGLFRVAAAMLFCMTAAEWCIAAWGATFVEDAAGVSADTAVSLMAGSFGGVVARRTLGSRLARRYDPAALLGVALAPVALVLGAAALVLVQRARTRPVAGRAARA